MDPTVAELYEDRPPPTCPQLLDDADFYAVPHNVPIMSSCLNFFFSISSRYSALITAYVARWGMGVGAFLTDYRGEVMDE